MWHYDAEIIGNLTQQDIIDAVNRVEKNSLTGTDYASLLGKVSGILLPFFSAIAKSNEIMELWTENSRNEMKRAISSAPSRWWSSSSRV